MTQLRDHLKAPVDDARLERQWSALNERGLPGTAHGGRRRLVWALSGALAMAAIGALAQQLLGEHEAPAPKAEKAAVPATAPIQLPIGAVLESDETEVAVQLSDGSHVALAPRAQMRVRSNRPKVVELELEEGRARFDVVHDTTRTFAIRIGDAEVHVLGTRFDVQREERTDGTFVRVSVTEGVVEVRRKAEIARIQAGETWTATFAHEQIGDGSRFLGNEPKTEKPRTVPYSPKKGDASELFGQATLARRAGRMREAAESYGALLERFPNDARTGLSAFELGRLRMDALNDQAGAIDALERSLKASGSASFREDALARIVVASDALGRTQQCLRARERYTKQYPNGVHASALAQRCQ
jgi:TolA-binding protein